MHLPMPTIFRPLRSRYFFQVWAGQAVSGVGDGIFPVALTLAVLGTGRGPIGLGIVLTADAVGSALGALAGGVIADRFGRLITMVGADLIRLVCVLILVATYRHSFAATAVCAALVGLGGSLFSPAYFAIVPELAGDGDLKAINGLRSATTRATRLVGPVLGGFLAAAYSPGAALTVDAATFAVSILTLVGVRSVGRRRAALPAQEGIFHSAQAGLKAVTGQARWIGVIILQGSLQMAFVMGPESILLPLVLHERRDIGFYGIILAVQGLGTLAGVLIAVHMKPRYPGLTAVLSMLSIVPELIFLGTHLPVILLALSVAATGWGYSTFAVFWGTALQQQVPEEYLSRVASLDSLGGFTLLPASIAVTGVAVAGAGLETVIAISGAMLIITTLLPLFVAGVPQFANPEAESQKEQHEKLDRVK